MTQNNQREFLFFMTDHNVGNQPVTDKIMSEKWLFSFHFVTPAVTKTKILSNIKNTNSLIIQSNLS